MTQHLQNSIPDLLFVYDDGNNTRKMQFQLSGITAGNTRVLSVPDATTTIVGTDTIQTLTNKTLPDSINNHCIFGSCQFFSGTWILIAFLLSNFLCSIIILNHRYS